MAQTAENNLWYKGKGDILREFKKNSSAILATVASRNFSSMPGFAVEAFTEIETETKFKLSDYNQKILNDAIDREMKKLGVGNDIAIKQAMLEWELQKLELFSDLQKEFSDKDQLRALKSEEIESLMIEQDIRDLAVALAKASIEKESEAIKILKTEAEVSPELTAAQEALLVAQEATANRKLEVIPHILAALAAQRTALETESAQILPARQEKANFDIQVANATEALIPTMEAKAAATAALTVKQGELLDPIIEKATATLELTTKQAELLPLMTEKATAQTSLTTKQRELLDPMMRKADATVALTEEQGTLIDPLMRKADKTTELTAKQSELLDPMTRKADKTMELTEAQAGLLDPMLRKAAATESLTVALKTLFDPMRLKAQASQDLADTLIEQLANHRLIAVEKVKMATEKVTRLGVQLELSEKELSLDSKKITIERDRAELELLRAEAKLAVVDALRVQLGEIRTAMTSEAAAEVLMINAQGTNEVAVKKSYIEKVEMAKYAASKAAIISETGSVNELGIEERNHADRKSVV